MRTSPNGHRPKLNSTTIRQLEQTLRIIRRRRPTVDDEVNAVKGGDDQVLLELARRAQDGNDDAAVAAVSGLLPRLCGVVISRHPTPEWWTIIDEYISLSFLTLIDITANESPAYLADKIIARTRRRYERLNKRSAQLVPSDAATLDFLCSPTDDVELRVLARLELHEIARAIADGVITETTWQQLVDLRIVRPGDHPETIGERQRVRRAQRQLGEWRNAAA